MIEFDRAKLKRIREAAGFSHARVAVEVEDMTGIDVTIATLRNYETNGAPVQFLRLYAMAKVLGVKVEDLFKNGGKRKAE